MHEGSLLWIDCGSGISVPMDSVYSRSCFHSPHALREIRPPEITYAKISGSENQVTEAGNFGRVELDALFSAAYDELRRLALTVKRADGSPTLNPTALVNEAWLKLANSPGFHAASRLHFKRIAARAMRQVLVEAARRRNSDKRGGAIALITLDDSLEPVDCEDQLLGIDTALDELAKVRPRQAMIVESRFFGGLEVPEVAQLLEVSEATVVRDWRAAKAWLAQTLRK
jgi:RNA polymerase sigma factor (TIGR02999 family)